MRIAKIDAHSPLVALATRLGCTEGQVYTMAIGLTFAVLLALTVPRTMEGEALAAAPVPSPPTESGEGPATSDVPEVASADLPPPPVASAVTPPRAAQPSAPSGQPVAPADAPDPAPPAPSPNTPSGAPPGSSPGEDEDDSCPEADGLRPLVDSLGETDLVPNESTMLLLERASGCSSTNEVVLALGLLAEIGSGLPDPGPRIPVVPVPPAEIPQEIVDEMQHFREAIDPICDALGDVATVFFFGFSTWPAGMDQLVVTPLRQVLLVCGQLRP